MRTYIDSNMTFYFFRKDLVLEFKLATFSMSSVIGWVGVAIAIDDEKGDGIGVGLGILCC